MTDRERQKLPSPPKTGWPPGMLQDDQRKLSLWLANRIDSRRHAREAAAAIGSQSEADAIWNRRVTDGVPGMDGGKQG
jgi:hypothetical protein